MKNLIKIARRAKEPLSENPTRTLQSGKGVVTGTPRQPLMSSLFNLPTKVAAILCLLLTLGSGNVWGTPQTVTYTAASTSTVNTSGTAPTGSSASLSGNGSFNSPWIQCTNGKSKALTLTGYEGNKITAITIHVKSNSSKGTGSFTAVAGSTTIASIAESAFNSANWNSSWNTSGVDKVLTMTDDDYEVQEDETVVLTISCKSGSSNYNSLYINSYTITYEPVSAPSACAQPSFSPAGKTYTSTQNVTISCETADATIRYTTDGTDPSKTVGIVYSSAISVSSTTTIKAIAYKDGMTDSSIATATYTIVDCDWFESFDGCNSTGGNDDSWNGTIATGTFTDGTSSDNSGWSVVAANAADRCLKCGSGGTQGSAQTPTLTGLTGTLTLSFKAAAWNSNSEQTTLNLSTTSGTLSDEYVTLVKGEWTLYEVTISNVTSAPKITFQGYQASNSRFFLDDVCVKQAATTYTVDYNAGGAEGTVPSSHTGLSGTTNITLASPTNLTAPSGKVFRGWSNDSGSSYHQPGDEVSVSAATTFTAYWVDAPIVYLKNTMNWANAYVSFYKDSYWDNTNGSGSSRASDRYVADPAAMTYNEATGLFSYTCPSYYTYTYASFTKDNQADYANFHETEAIYCDNNLEYDTKVVVATTQSGTATHNSTKYYKTYSLTAYASATGTGYYCAGDFNSFETLGNEFTVVSGVLTYTKSLSANTRYGFKIYHHGDYWRNDGGAFVHSIEDWSMVNTNGYNTYFISGPAGTYTFTYDQNDHEVSVTYPDCGHPCANYAYFENTNNWTNVYAHIYKSNTNEPINAWHGVPLSLTTSICNHTYYYGAVECSNYDEVIYNDGGSNQITAKSTSSCSGKHSDASTTTWTAFATYTITYAAGTGSGDMTATSGICPGVDQNLPACTFDAPSHSTFAGWKTNTAVTINGSTSIAVDGIIPALATINSVSANITLTAQWEAAATAEINLVNYSGTSAPTDKYPDETWTLPTTNSYTCGLKTFVGWSTVAVDSPTKPTAATYYEPGDHVTLGATNIFYAVFADDNSVEDEITLSSTGVSAGSSSYSSWSGVTDQSDAEYAGNSAGGHSADNGSIQLRSNKSNSGVVTTTSGGTATKVVVAWNSYMSQERNIDVYGKNTAYSAASDLYGDNQGTLLGSITWTSQTQGTELTITGDYAYIGLRSRAGALYLDDITITWSSGYSNYSTTCVTYYDINTAVSPAASGSVTLSQSSAPEGGTATATAVPAEGYGFGSWAITGGATLSSTSTNPTTITMGSADATITATFLPKCATPTFSPAGSTYTSAQSVTISSSTTGSTIYYTTDGSDPTTESSHGTAGDASVTINVSSTTTIKAIAVKSGTNANSDIASATYTIKTGKLFSLVTDASDLAAGDELVILGSYNSNNYLMSTTQNNNNRGKTDENSDWELMGSDVFVEEKVGSTVQVIELEGSAEGWYFKVGEDGEEVPQYLYAASSSSNYLRTADLTTAGDNAKWTIEIGSADTYYATITAQGSNTRNIMRYNGSNNPPIFSCYGSASQQPIQLYRYANTAPRVNVGTPSGNSFSYVYKSGPSDAQTFTVSGNNLTGNVVITPPSNYQIKNGSGDWGTSAITLTPDGNGAIAITTISVRLASGLNAGSYNGNITFTNNDELTIPNIAVTGTVSKATLNPLFEMLTYTIIRNVSTSTTFAFVNLPDDYTGTVTYSRTNTPTPSARLVIDGTNKTFTAADYSGRWTVTANFPADANYNLKNGVTCTVNALTRDTYVDNVNSQSVSEEQATDNGVDPYISPALDDVAAGAACQGTKTHLLGWATQAFVTNVGNGTLSGDKSDYTEANGFYAIGTTLPAASNATYYAVWGELDE